VRNVAGGFIVTGAGEGGSSHVQVFDATTGQVLFSFFPYDIGFLGGVRVAAVDINGDGIADLVVGTGPGGAAHIRLFDGRALLQARPASYWASSRITPSSMAGSTSPPPGRRPAPCRLQWSTPSTPSAPS
jgi:hypothetical protein